MSRAPIVLVTATRQEEIRGTPGHFARETYIRALAGVAGAQPLLVPLPSEFIPDIDGLLDIAGGLLLTGAAEHLDPALYGGARAFSEDQLDPQRDSSVMRLLKAALARDMPVLAICRGFQEMNVCHGGSLHQHVHKLPGKNDHRRKQDVPVMDSYTTFSHAVKTQKGGLFERWGLPETFSVNSIHEQGADRVGTGLHVEAVSDDGLVEAISLPGKRFALALQWHPEGTCFSSPPDRRVFEEFGRAVRAS